MKKNLKILIVLKIFLQKAQKDRIDYIKNTADFTRNRILTFERVVLLIISLIKRSLSIELREFFEQFKGPITCTKSAFSQQRKKLKHQFFIDWNNLLVNSFYTFEPKQVKRWKSHRLFGVDGSTAYLINKEEIVNYFGVQGNDNKQVPMALIMNCYDVLNELSVKSAILPISCSEIFIAEQWIETFTDDMIGIYDRGYASFAFMYLNILGYEQEKKFIIRCPNKTFLKGVRDFEKSGKTSQIVKINATYKAIQHLKMLGYKLDKATTIKIRLIRVVLENGETEILATNLLDGEEYPVHEFKELYFKRWPVETEYNKMKNKCQIEIFSGHSIEAIKQDFYAAIFVMNLHSLLLHQCQNDLEIINRSRKLKYKINRNVTIGILKRRIVHLFLSNSPCNVLWDFKQDFIKELEPVRPGRKIPRVKPIKRINKRYYTVTNYRRAV